MNRKQVFEKMIEEEKATKRKLFYSAVYLFASKGYANVGIRELCRSVNVKESAFYNHYSSKEELFRVILGFFEERNEQVVFTEQEIDSVVKAGSVRNFFLENMKKFSEQTSGPIYHAILQIILTESYVNEEAAKIAMHNLYYFRRGYTEEVLRRLMAEGHIKECSVSDVTAAYYYALKGLLDEFLLLETWEQDTGAVTNKILSLIDYFVKSLEI